MLARAGNAGARCEYEQTGVSRHLGGQPAAPHLHHLLHHLFKSASGATRPPAGTLLQQCAGVVSTVSSYLPVACLNFSQNMVSSPSHSTFLLSLPPTFLLLLLPNLSSPGKTGLLVAGGEGAMTSAEVAFPLNVVLPSFKFSHTDAVGLIQNPNIPTATRLSND